MNFTMVLGGVLADANGDYQRPVLFLFARTIKSEHMDSAVLEVFEI